jgi:hypothetical protein
MSSDLTADPLPSSIDYSVAGIEIEYLEQRLHTTMVQLAAAAGTPSRASHAGLADLYRLEISQLRSGPNLAVIANPLLDQAREARVVERSCEKPSRPKLSLGWRRDAQG